MTRLFTRPAVLLPVRLLSVAVAVGLPAAWVVWVVTHDAAQTAVTVPICTVVFLASNAAADRVVDEVRRGRAG